MCIRDRCCIYYICNKLRVLLFAPIRRYAFCFAFLITSSTGGKVSRNKNQILSSIGTFMQVYNPFVGGVVIRISTEGVSSQPLPNSMRIASYGACLVGKMFLDSTDDTIWPNVFFGRNAAVQLLLCVDCNYTFPEVCRYSAGIVRPALPFCCNSCCS